MARKAGIGGDLYGDWYGAHAMDRSGSLWEENIERRICRCASLRSGSGVESVARKSEAFRTSFAASPVVYASSEYRCRREECNGMMGLYFMSLQLKTAVK